MVDHNIAYEKKVIARLDRIIRLLRRLVDQQQPRKPVSVVVTYGDPQKE